MLLPRSLNMKPSVEKKSFRKHRAFRWNLSQKAFFKSQQNLNSWQSSVCWGPFFWQILGRAATVLPQLLPPWLGSKVDLYDTYLLQVCRCVQVGNLLRNRVLFPPWVCQSVTNHCLQLQDHSHCVQDIQHILSGPFIYEGFSDVFYIKYI